MKTKIIFSAIALLICISTANAETCTTTTTDTPAGFIPSVAQEYIGNCSNVSYTNYYAGTTVIGNAVYSTPQCTDCIWGDLITFYNDESDVNWTATCEDYNPSFTICAQPCTSSCVSDTDWGNDDSGYLVKWERSCSLNNKVCNMRDSYRCDNGYYGTANADGTDGCHLCPHPDRYGYYYANSMHGKNTFITDCFISKSSSSNSFTDLTGNYKCTEDAYYKM